MVNSQAVVYVISVPGKQVAQWLVVSMHRKCSGSWAWEDSFGQKGRWKDESQGTGTAECWCVWRVAGTGGVLFVKTSAREAGIKCQT